MTKTTLLLVTLLACAVFAAAQEHLDRMKSLEATTRKMLEAGLLTARELAAVRYHRTEAEILLFRLKGP